MQCVVRNGMMLLLRSAILAAGVVSAVALPQSPSQPTQEAIVDLGYARYQGVFNSTDGLNVWKGIRYAQPPVGNLRWQAPKAPVSDNKDVLPAESQPPLCPQSGAAKLPAEYGFVSGPGNEDCLYLNVYAPPEAKDLPVFFWIHGGGYGLFGATQDPSPMMIRNDNKFISVVIQYRLGAFGFLSSNDVKQYGAVNAGLLDMNFALQWVQAHISKFGGDPAKVTIAGESSGAGSVLYQAMAYGGNQSQTLFQNLIVASPFLPPQFKYNDTDPTKKYSAFVEAAGCNDKGAEKAVFNCLVQAESAVLQNASAKVSESGAFGTFGFLPVTDGDFVREIPSVQLLQGKVNGQRILSGNNANEGVPLAPATTTQAEFDTYINTTFPLLTDSDIERLYQAYPVMDDAGPVMDTLGNSTPTALEVSEFGRGQKQRTFNLYGETTFSCPSYWLAEAFALKSNYSWKYQYSVTPAYHGADLTAYFSRDATVPTKGFISAFQKIWGNFIISGSPVISVADAMAGMDNATVPAGAQGISWPAYSHANPTLMNLNTTGGQEELVTVTEALSFKLRMDPGVVNVFNVADGLKWEGGRGARCDFWRSVGARVPQ